MTRTKLILSTLVLSLLMPQLVLAAEPRVGSVDQSALTTTSSKPTLTGMAFGATSVKVAVYKEGKSKAVFKSKALKVRDFEWKAKVSKKLSDGEYRVVLTAGSEKLAEETLVVGKKSATENTTVVVNPILLLTGGVVHAGQSVPVSYLQLTNTGKENATLRGFWLTQSGSANTDAIVGLSTVDDKGGARGVSNANPFTGGKAFAPTEVTTIAPGQIRLFTIKAQLTSAPSAYIGQTWGLQVSGVDTGAKVQGTFPIRGTTWVIAN